MRMLAVGTREVAPTLAASCAALPPGGAAAPAARGYSPHACRFAYGAAPRGGRCACGLAKPVPRPWPGWGNRSLACDFSHCTFSRRGCGAFGPAEPVLRPYLAWDSISPTLVTSRHSLSCRIRQAGFTLIELLIVVAIMAIATAGVGLALRDSSSTALEREAQRLAVLLDSARVQSRMMANPVRWRPTPTGFAFEGLTTGSSFPATWLGQDVRVAGNVAILLGPEPVIGPQQIRLVSISQPARSLTLATDGIRPFAVVTDGVP